MGLFSSESRFEIGPPAETQDSHSVGEVLRLSLPSIPARNKAQRTLNRCYPDAGRPGHDDWTHTRRHPSERLLSHVKWCYGEYGSIYRQYTSSGFLSTIFQAAARCLLTWKGDSRHGMPLAMAWFGGLDIWCHRSRSATTQEFHRETSSWGAGASPVYEKISFISFLGWEASRAM